MYGFICRFTQLKSKVEGLDSPMEYVRCWSYSPRDLLTILCICSFEEALMNKDVDPVMNQILSRFVLNLRPQARNLRRVHVCVVPIHATDLRLRDPIQFRRDFVQYICALPRALEGRGQRSLLGGEHSCERGSIAGTAQGLLGG